MSVDDDLYVIPQAPPPVPKFAVAAIAILMVGVISMVVYMVLRPKSLQVTVPGKELVIGIDKATLYVPKDAAILDGVISISSLQSNVHSIAGEEAEWFRSQVVEVEYLNRQGLPYQDVTFPKPVLICFMINELWQDYTQHPDEYLVQYYAEEQSPPGWVTLPMSANPDRHQLCGQTNHLSIFALAMKPQEDIIPITGSTRIPTATGSLSPTPTGAFNPAFSPTPTNANRGAAATPVSTQAALTATSVALTATDVPPTSVPPTNVPPTNVPTVVPTDIPTIVPTDIPAPTATDPPVPTATDPPVQPTDPPPPPTDPPPPPTDPPVVP